MVNAPSSTDTWVRDRFVEGARTSALWPTGFPWTQELVDDQAGAPDVEEIMAAALLERGVDPAGSYPEALFVDTYKRPPYGSKLRLRERFRILGCIFRLLRR